VLEGRVVGEGATVEVSRGEGTWRVYARCGEVASRIREVAVTPTTRREVVLEPRIDTATHIEDGTVVLRYDQNSEERANLIGDLAAIGTNLHARAVAARWHDVVLVVDPARRALTATLRPGDAESLLAVLTSVADRAPVALPENTVANSAQRETANPLQQTVAGGRTAGLWPWIVAGVGATLLVTSVVTYFLREDAESELQRSCVGGGGGVFRCPEDISPRGDTVHTLETARIVTLAVGGAAMLGGVVWWLLDAPRTSEPRVTVGPSFVGVVGRF
jgi:hypothetical protein